MGAMRFKVDPAILARYSADLRKATIIGMDRTPVRLTVEIRDGMLVCHREGNESGRLSIPWPVDGVGLVSVSTATLSERLEPYVLAVELARGRLNEARNQAADWQQLGLRIPPEFEPLLARSRTAFVRAALGGLEPTSRTTAAQESIGYSWQACHVLARAYSQQVLDSRLAVNKLATLLGFGLDGDPAKILGLPLTLSSANSTLVSIPWRSLSPAEGQFRWEPMDAAMSWAKRQKLTIQAGPIFDFSTTAIPDWLKLWDRDFATIQDHVADLVKQVVGRYRGQVAVWHVVGRPASSSLLGLSEEQQVRLTAKCLQVARLCDPSAQLVVDFDRPWAEWMSSSPFQLGPLHFADYLARADLGLTGVGIELAPSYLPSGSQNRDLFDFSKLLDLYALLNLPLYITLAIPASAAPDALAEAGLTVAADQWGGSLDDARQMQVASEWMAMAVAKPFVRSVIWSQVSDARPHRYPHAGLIRPDHTPRPLLATMKLLRSTYLAP